MRLERGRSYEIHHRNSENNQCTHKSRSCGNHKRFEQILESHHHSFETVTPRVGSLARNGQPQIQSQICRNLRPRHTCQQLLRPTQRLILSAARLATRKMFLQSEHLRARHCPIQIRRKQLLCLGTLQSLDFSCAHLPNANHGITSTLLPPPSTCDRELFFSRFGAVNPSSSPTSRTYGASLCRSASLPRVSRDFTVPSEISSTSAISSYDISSRSRRTSVVRYGSGTFLNSSSTRACTSWCATLSNGESA